jgi:hypothetical protein
LAMRGRKAKERVLAVKAGDRHIGAARVVRQRQPSPSG